jgi:hypothetical protein
LPQYIVFCQLLKHAFYEWQGTLTHKGQKLDREKNDIVENSVSPKSACIVRGGGWQETILGCSRLAAIFCMPPAASRSKNLFSAHKGVKNLRLGGHQAVIYAHRYTFRHNLRMFASYKNLRCSFSLLLFIVLLYQPMQFFFNFKLHFVGENSQGGKIFSRFCL